MTIKPLARSIRFGEDTMWVNLEDGRQLGVPLAYFPRLLKAQPDQRESYELGGGGAAIHWEELDEDISVEGLLLGVGDRTRR